MTIRVGINGFGRIGRDVFRIATDRAENGLRIVAVNDVTGADTLAHLLRYDSTYGTWHQHEVSATPAAITVDGTEVRVLREPDPARLPWAELGVDIVIEATGRFRTRDAAAAHLTAGAKKVVITAPGKNVDATIVLGVNDTTYRPEQHHIVSNASCTTNCLA
ncbi:MAG TPA: glyceraldehyde 3-phosphate dehydrogenase NAD-binding domain-containing protein, partial [Actinophytocola sp.]|uniref:glyceraldehyde 3-phosphate dehydrogenase NAD-binding domain-containing protein n=1 Tax=Actinophytocola sp. TaxID=1872138 RepID=UPI002DBF420B